MKEILLFAMNEPNIINIKKKYIINELIFAKDK